MAEERTEGAGEFRTERVEAALWFAVLAGPTAWILGMLANYSLVRVACAKHSMLSLHLVSLGALLLALGGGAVAWREWRRAGSEWPGEGSGPLVRSRFMAVIGVLASAFFTLVIVAQWIAQLFLNPCMGI
ncbi:MAG TPA: hypothetical protein VFL93_16795 [Longimicrobiaceae bacterium]|nr:hypothetical protein [Longimicrobiaceae bacterium]